MTASTINGIRIEFEDSGPQDAPAFLLIRGLSTQLIQWPEIFLRDLNNAGFRVIRFDNRDAGLSQKFSEAGTPAIGDLLAGSIAPPYTLADMAADTVGVLDALGVERAHIAGMSLGGMVAQHCAFTHGDRCLSVTSVMSTSGEPGLPPATPEAMEALTSQPSDPSDREVVIQHNMRTQRVLGSPGFPPSEEELRSYFERAYDRCYCPDGSARQMAAVISDGGRGERLRGIDLPFLVLHGSDDPLIPPACGQDTVKHVRGAKHIVVPGMGHDLTEASSSVIAGHLIDHARTAA